MTMKNRDNNKVDSDGAEFSRPLYPVSLDIGGKRCLVVGGGAVAARKIKALLLCGGLVQIISPQGCQAIARLAESSAITWHQRGYRQGDVKDAFLVFAATDDPGVQKMVAEDAARHHVLLNSADNPLVSDFHVPAKIRRRDLVIAISTGGGSPALARLLKMRLAREYGEEYGVLVELMSRIRRLVVSQSSNAEKNKTLFQSILELPVLECIKNLHWDELQRLLETELPADIDVGLLIEEMVGELSADEESGN
jgi:precorrin-2 dehydrogenase/sirohydrochlorin ferrochelatase